MRALLSRRPTVARRVPADAFSEGRSVPPSEVDRWRCGKRVERVVVRRTLIVALVTGTVVACTSPTPPCGGFRPIQAWAHAELAIGPHKAQLTRHVGAVALLGRCRIRDAGLGRVVLYHAASCSRLAKCRRRRSKRSDIASSRTPTSRAQLVKSEKAIAIRLSVSHFDVTRDSSQR
jgi:hypothetical protein